MPKKLSGNTSPNLRFNMGDDDAVRAQARRGYEIAKLFKEAGVKYKRIIPASYDASVRKLFRLPISSDLICLEIKQVKDEQENMELIGDAKDLFLTMDNMKLIDEKKYTYESNNIVYRFLIKLT